MLENSSISESRQTMGNLASGERRTVQFTVYMVDTSLKSAGVVIYFIDGQTETITLPEINIP